MRRADVVLVAESDYYLPETDLYDETTCFSPIYDYIAAPLRKLGLPLQYQLRVPQRPALAVLASQLRRSGFSVEVADNIFRDPAENERFEGLLRARPLAVGISTGCLHKAESVSRIAEAVRRLAPEARIILGGVGAGLDPEMRRCADVTVVGPGEEALSEMLRSLAPGKPGALPEKIISGTVDMKTIPAPAWDAFSTLPSSCFSVEASKGCRYRCLFCSYPLLGRQDYRPVENVIQEIATDVDRYGAEYIRFVDTNLTSDPDYALSLCTALRKAKLKVPWSCFSRIDELARSPELCARMAEAGCFWIYSGIESGQEGILAAMQKGYTPQVIPQGIRNAHAAGILMHGNFVVGFPGETPATLKSTTELIKRSGLDTVSFTVLGVTPSLSGYMAAHSPRMKETLTFAAAAAAAKAAIRDICLCPEAPLIVTHGIAMYYLLGAGLSVSETMGYFSAIRDFHRALGKDDALGTKTHLGPIERAYLRTAPRFGWQPRDR